LTKDARQKTQSHEAPRLAGRQLLLVPAALAAAFLVFGLIAGGGGLIAGLGRIFLARDTLITDYIGVGGIGAAFVNAGLLGLVACVIFWRTGAPVGGASLAALLLVLGFGLFGKNLLNIWPIIAGVALYARFKGEAFAAHINTALFSCALAPLFSEILFSTLAPLPVRLPLALASGIGAGFILPPAAAQLFRAHDGHSLYNVGFAAGVVGAIMVALYKSFGFIPEPAFIWTTDNNLLLAPLLASLFLGLIAAGLWADPEALPRHQRLLAESGRAPSDFVAQAGAGAVLVNLGLCGLISLVYVLAVGGDLNGPSIGALMTVVGFAGFGKHPKNIWPIMAGVALGALTKSPGPAEPTFLLAALFGTTLAPIAGRFGWGWGIAAGFVHSSLVHTVGALHGGLNLYNNGFAAGIVASVLAPIALAIQSRRDDHPEERL